MTTDAFGDELEIDTNSDSIEELKKMFEDSDSEELENKSTGTYTSLDVVKFTINKDNILQYYDAESKSNIEYDSNTLKVILLSKSCFIQLYDKTSTKFYNSNEYSFLEDNTRIELFSFDNGKRVSRGVEMVSEWKAISDGVTELFFNKNKLYFLFKFKTEDMDLRLGSIEFLNGLYSKESDEHGYGYYDYLKYLKSMSLNKNIVKTSISLVDTEYTNKNNEIKTSNTLYFKKLDDQVISKEETLRLIAKHKLDVDKSIKK